MGTSSWTLLHDSLPLGRLVSIGLDQPWQHCSFVPTSSFSEIEHLFRQELKLLNEDRMEEWETVCEAIDSLNLVLRTEGGEEFREFLLHIDGDEAWFRS